MKILSYNKAGTLDACNDICVELPSYVLSYDESKPILNIDEDEYSIVTFKQDSEVAYNYLLNKMRFFVRYDYRLFTLSEPNRKSSRTLYEYPAVSHIPSVSQSLSLLLSKRFKTSLINKEEELESLVAEINKLSESNILYALIAYAEDSIARQHSYKEYNEAFAISFSNLLKRTYYAINNIEKFFNVSQNLLDIKNILRPFISHDPTKNSVFEDDLVIKKLIELLFVLETEHKSRSTTYRLISILENFNEDTSNPMYSFHIAECDKLPEMEFRMGYVGHKRIMITMSEAEFVSISRMHSEVPRLIDSISNVLKELNEDYLSEQIDEKRIKDILKNNVEAECREKNTYCENLPYTWRSFLMDTIKTLKQQVDKSFDKVTPQNSYDALLYDMYCKLASTNVDYWEFDKYLIEDLLYKLYQHPHDDQSHLFETMFKLNYIKSNVTRNASIPLTTIDSLGTIGKLDWSKMDYESESPEEAIKRVMLFIEPMLQEKKPSNRNGFIRTANELTLKKNPLAIKTIDEFKDRFRKVLCSENIKWEIMTNHPKGKQKGKGFRCGFNAMLLCNILGLLMQKEDRMKYPPIENNGSRLAQLLFTDRGVGTESYKNYIYKYDEYITSNNNKTRYSVLTQEMYVTILNIFTTV